MADKLKLTPRARRYIEWINKLNALAPGHIFLRSKWTWRAFCQGIEPEKYLQGYGRGR